MGRRGGWGVMVISPTVVRILGEVIKTVRDESGKELPIIHPITLEHQKEYLEFLLEYQDEVIGIRRYEYDTFGDNTGLYLVIMAGTPEEGDLPILNGRARRIIFEIIDKNARQLIEESLSKIYKE